MQTGDTVYYKEQKAIIIEIKWGLYCIRFNETKRQIWVTPETLIRKDF